MIERQELEVRAGDLGETEIYVVRSGESLGPFTKQELLSDDSVEANDLIKIGTEGKPFPAAFILHRRR